MRMFMKPGEDPNVVCDKCKDDRRGKPWLGLNIIRGMKRNGAEYTNGTILDPRDGDLYSAMMTLTPGWPDARCSRLSRHFIVGADVPLFVEHCEAVAAEIDVKLRWIGEQARRGLSVWSDALPVRHVMLEVACEPSVVGSL